MALGAHQPELPVFTSSSPAELAASVADRTALLGGDATAPVAWLNRAAVVRSELELPALFLPNNYTRDVPSVSLKDLLVRVEGWVAAHRRRRRAP